MGERFQRPAGQVVAGEQGAGGVVDGVDLPGAQVDPVLDRLVGPWDVAAEWEKVPGRGLHRFAMSVRNEWVYDGRALESRYVGPTGTEDSQVTYAYDPTASDYVAFAVTRLSTSFVLERGHYDSDGPSLVFDSDPMVGVDPHPPRYRRSLWFLGDDEYAIRISNPDDSSTAFIGMYLTHTRSS